MAKLAEITRYSNQLLEIDTFKDYAPNGLQVEGKSELKRLVTGVTANQALIEQAIDAKADAILVHHGFFWKSESPCVTGIKYQRLKLLLDHGISLLAYHLPLDAHPSYGNNAVLAAKLGIEITGLLPIGQKPQFGNIGRFKQPITLTDFDAVLQKTLQFQPILVPSGDHPIKTIAWCTGGAQGFLDAAIESGVDAYLTGEISESVVHTARESGVHFIAAGHHATERYGVQALGAHLAEKFNLQHQFIDIPSPV